MKDTDAHRLDNVHVPLIASSQVDAMAEIFGALASGMTAADLLKLGLEAFDMVQVARK